MNYARVGSGWHVSMMGGHTNYSSGNGNAVFLVSRYGGAARGRRWWGNRTVGLVLSVHTEVIF